MTMIHSLLLVLLATSVVGLQINSKQSLLESDMNLSFIYLSEAIHEAKNSADQILYYSLSLENTKFGENEALTISVISTERTFISVYISTVPELTQISQSILPTRDNSKIQCNDYNVITCPLFEVQSDQVVLIALQIRDPVEFILLADHVDIQKLEIDGLAQTVQLTDRFANIFLLDLTQMNSQGYQEVIVNAQYLSEDFATDYKIFSICAGPVQFNTSQSFIQKYRSFSLGGYAQQLALFNTSQSYYIILTGQSDLSLTLSASKPSAQIKLSNQIEYLYDSSIEYEVSQIKQFSYNTANDHNITEYGIYIQKIRGSGAIIVSVCQFSYNFTNQLGFSEYIVIGKDILDCPQPLIKIKLANLTWQLGVRFIVEPYEQQQDDETLYYFEQRVQVLNQITSQCTTYYIEPFPDNTQQQHIILRYFTTITKQNFVFKTCKFDSNQQIQCTPLSITQQKFYMINNVSQIAQVQVCLNQTAEKIANRYYGILIGIYPETKTVDLNKQTLGFVNSDEIVLYRVNGVSKKSGNTTLQVRVKLINGDITFNQNCSENINTNFCHDNDEYDAWHYSASYNLSQFDQNQFGNIKFGVTGIAQSIFSVVAYLDEHIPEPQPPGPTPTPTPTPIEMIYLLDGQNNITISNQPVLLFYSAHILPYNITIPYSDNLCIQQFQILSLIDQTPLCSAGSTLFKSGRFLSDSFYLRISTKTDSQNSTQLRVNITVPTITMTDVQFVILSCKKYCYSSVKVTYFNWNQDSVININGPGYLNSSTGSNLTSLKFQTVPFVFTAVLPNGGDLYIQILDGTPNVVTKTKQNFVLDYFTPLTVIVPVSDQDASTILVNSFGRKFSASWRFYSFNLSQQNALMYSYPQRGDTILYKSPPYSSSSTPITLQNSEQNKIPLSCDSYQKQMACFYTVFLKNAEQSLDILNDNGDIEINLNNQIQFMSLNLPMVDTTEFGVAFYDAVLLQVSPDKVGGEAVYSNLQITEDLISIQPISACGTLEVGVVNSSVIFGPSSDNTSVVQVYSTEPCSYNIAITSCPLPLTFTSTPMQFSLDAKHQYRTLYTPSSQSNYFNIRLWMNLSQAKQAQNFSSLIVSVYEVMNHLDCISSKNVLVSTSIVSVGSVPIYSTSDTSTIKISVASDSTLYLIYIAAEKPTLPQPPLTLLISSTDSITLLPNNQPQPVFSSPLTYTYHTLVNAWQFCYISIIGSDSHSTIDVTIDDEVGSLISRNIKMQDKQNCISIGRRSGSGNQYTITIASVKASRVDVLYIYSKQYVQSIQTNHPHTALYQPQSMLLSSPNSKYGHCYNYDITNIQTAINIIFYPITPLPPSQASTNTIHVPGTKLKSLYDIKQIQSSRTGDIISYEVQVHLDQVEEDNIQVCFKYDDAFYTKIIDEFDNFKVVFNEQRYYNNISNEPNMTALQIYKFTDLTLTTPAPAPAPKQWLITQIIQCDHNLNSNMTLLGSYALNDILMGNIAQFQQMYTKYNVLVAMAALDGHDHFFIGIKYAGGENITYSINSFKVADKILPHSRWNISESKINAYQSEDKKDLIVQLPSALTSQSNNQANIKYTLYVVSRQDQAVYNLSAAYLRCPGLPQLSSKLTQKNITIYNISLVNPKVEVFKISVDLLPGRKLAVLAQAQINQTNTSMPITYFYNTQNIDIQTNKSDGGDGDDDTSGGPHITLILLMLGIAVLLVILFRLVYKIVRRRMSANTIQFELSEQSNQPPPSTQASPTPAPQRQSVRDTTGYGEFVEEEVSV